MHRCALFEHLLLDTGALYHVIPHEEWYFTYSAGTDWTLQIVMWQALAMYALYLHMVDLYCFATSDHDTFGGFHTTIARRWICFLAYRAFLELAQGFACHSERYQS